VAHGCLAGHHSHNGRSNSKPVITTTSLKTKYSQQQWHTHPRLPSM
jgi:hypothetical protein